MLRLPAVRPALLRCLRSAVPHGCLSVRSCGRPAPLVYHRPGLIGHSDAPMSGVLMRRRQGLPGSRGTFMDVPCSQTPTGPRRQATGDASVLPSAFRTASAPAISVLTGLNHTAHPLAVYASQGGSPHHHATLASGCWPNFAGRDSLPAGSLRKVSAMPHNIASSFPELPWRNRNEPIARSPPGPTREHSPRDRVRARPPPIARALPWPRPGRRSAPHAPMTRRPVTWIVLDLDSASHRRTGRLLHRAADR